MGIRVDSKSLDEQLTKTGEDFKREYDFHKGILEDVLPLTIGGGIGQSECACTSYVKHISVKFNLLYGLTIYVQLVKRKHSSVLIEVRNSLNIELFSLQNVTCLLITEFFRQTD